MTARLLLAWPHLLALGIGLAGVWARARALRDSLRDPEDHGALRRAFIADSWWGVAAGLWLVTGLWRLLAGTEKSTSYYFVNHVFYLKMALFLAVVGLEVWPMMTLMRWRTKKASPNPRDAGRIEVISYVQCALVVAIVLAAVSMARGYGAPTAAGATVGIVSPAAPAAIPGASAETTVPAVTPSGTETVTDDDIALLVREIAMPLGGVDPAALRSNFDERRGGGTRQHEALDIMAPRRTVVKSAAKGRVLKLFTSAAGGLMVYAADSSERFIMMYAHLDGYAPGLRDGAVLAQGQAIGYVGSTGNALASAPHLHFAVARSADVKRWSKGKPIDPLPVLQAAAKGAVSLGRVQPGSISPSTPDAS
jgi:murein DD-endopeptidase MepM/ murein hydrolase activator NlpD